MLPQGAVVPRPLALILFALALPLACNRPDDPRFSTASPRPSAEMQPVRIRTPDKLTSIESAELDAMGRPIRVSCASCHSQRKSETLPAVAEDMREFHRGLRFQHGTLVCGQCHVPGDASSLRFADGRKIPMTDVMLLCGQCHGPQLRDYKNGAHGGMRGYWDRTRGGRDRNNCVDCHDPHVPKYQAGQPVLPPRDRGLMNGKLNGGGHG